MWSKNKYRRDQSVSRLWKAVSSLKRNLQLESLERRDLMAAMSPEYTLLSSAIRSFAGSSNSGYTPAQIRSAYDISGMSFGSSAADGSGQTIAIVDAYDDPNIAADLAAFDAAYGIAAPPSLTVVNQNGGTSLPRTDPQQGWELETALDVEWAHAIAPGAKIILVEANSASDTDLFAAVNYARQLAGVSVISMSWGSDDSTANASMDQALSNKYLVTPSGHQGITFVAAAGDDGIPSFPAESPNVLAVGGTDLYLNSNGTIQNETAWTPAGGGAGSGGISKEFAGRKLPDVSYNAGVGFAVYDTFGSDHGWVSVGGTSAGAPQWAALIAIADQGRALSGASTLSSADTLAAIYSAPSADFHDITSGSTGYQSATTGYDLATGLGTPVANKLIPYLVTSSGSSSGSSGSGSSGSGSSGSGNTGSGSSGGTTTTTPAAPTNLAAQALSTSQVKLTWTDSANATAYQIYELVNGQSVLLGTVSGTSSQATITNLKAGTTYSFAVAAVNSAGTTVTDWVQVTTVSAPVATTLAAPTNVQVTASSSTVAQVSWTASAGATGYVVYEMVHGYAQVVGWTTAGATSLSVSGQTPGATETFAVVAYAGNSVAASAWVNVVMPAAPALSAPTNVVATAASTTSATLSWNASDGASGYAIYYKVGNRSVLLGTVGAGTTSVNITGLRAGTSYSFAVAAYNSTSIAASSWVSVTTPTITSTSASIAYAFASTKHDWWL